MHYDRMRVTGSVHGRKRMANGGWDGVVCSVDGCDDAVLTAGLCGLHYGRKARLGSPTATPPKRKPRRVRSFGVSRRERKLARKRLHGVKAYALKTGKGEILKVLRQRKCGICGEFFKHGDEKHIDHIIPLARGGTNDVSNLRMAHAHCNVLRGADVPPGTQLPLLLSC